jgi:hypothetical protein
MMAMTSGYRVKRTGSDGGESILQRKNPPPLKSMITTRKARMDNKELVKRLREALKYDGYNRMVADIIDELSPETDAIDRYVKLAELENRTMNKEKAGAYRGAAEFLEREGYRVSDVLRAKADELDPPRPEPGAVVWWHMDGGEWQVGIVSAHMQIIDSELDAYEFEEVEYKPARILAPDDPGDELQCRIQAAIEYIDAMWNHSQSDRASYRQDLLNLTSILDGRAEETE